MIGTGRDARRVLVAATLMTLGAARARAQQPVLPAPGEASFALLVGKDTIGVERAKFGGSGVDGELVDRAHGVRVAYALTLAAPGTAMRIETRVYRPATDTVVRQHATIELHGDTAIATVDGAPAPQRLPSRADALPYVNPSVALLQPVVARTRGSTGTAEVPLLQVAGGMTLPARVTWASRDSATIVIAGVTGYLLTDAAGALREFVVPAQGFRAVRASGALPVTTPAPDYAPPAGAPYTAESITLRTPAGLTLAGTLTLPTARPARGVPAVVTITGSGAQDRDESIPLVAGYRPFRQVADTLGRRGIAVLRLDDRGIGGSDAGPPSATSADYADDIRAALAYLRTRPEIDASRLALVGHSEGGMIAPMVAATDTGVRAIVLMAGPAWTGRRILAYQQRYALEHDTTMTPARRDSLLARAPAALDSAARASAWIRYFLEYDPLATARRVRVPVLILQGATDRQVTPEQASALAAALRAAGNRRVTVREFPETNHLFLADPSGDPAGYRSLRTGSVRPEVLGAIADWLSTQLR